MRLLIGTSNPGKILEIHDALGGLPLTLLQPSDVSISDTPHEHGSTYGENALLKARWYQRHSGLPTIADDSGIVVDALAEELGVQTRRWGAGADATDDAWIAHFLKRMEGESNRRARFVCAIAYIGSDGSTHLFEGVCEGSITLALEAPILPGLPLSSCFLPDGADKVQSAMSVDEKNRWSHRGRALHKLREHLASELSAL